MTRAVTSRPGDGPGSDASTAQAGAPPEVSPPGRSTPAADPTPEDEDHRAAPSAVMPFPDGCQRPAHGRSASSTAQVSELVVTRAATSPAEVEGIDAHEARLAQAARRSASVLPAADTVAAVQAGM